MNTHTLAIFGQLGGWEILLLALLGLLIFGRRLPEVGKSLGKGIVEFDYTDGGLHIGSSGEHDPYRFRRNFTYPG